MPPRACVLLQRSLSSPRSPHLSRGLSRLQVDGREDAATGSAAGCAISYLVRHRAVAAGVRIHLQQGIAIGRTSDLFLTTDFGAKATNVRFAGSTVSVADGRLFLQG